MGERSTKQAGAGPRGRFRLGELLVAEGLVTPQALEAALATTVATGTRLGQALVLSGAIGEEDLAKFLSRQLQLPFVNLVQFDVRPELVRLLPEAAARRRRDGRASGGKENSHCGRRKGGCSPPG